MNRLLTYPLLIWEFIGYMSIFTKQKQTSDLLPPAIGKLSIGPKSACPCISIPNIHLNPSSVFDEQPPHCVLFLLNVKMTWNSLRVKSSSRQKSSLRVASNILSNHWTLEKDILSLTSGIVHWIPCSSEWVRIQNGFPPSLVWLGPTEHERCHWAALRGFMTRD